MRQKLMVAALVLITAAYCWGLGWIAWGFSRAGGTIGWGLALGVGNLLALTVWVTWREVLFGLAAGRLVHEYRPEPGDQEQIEAEPSAAEEQQRAKEPVAADQAEFEAARTAIEQEGRQDWQAWFRLALAYDALRDRRSARAATRRAIEVRRQGPDPR